MTRAWAAPLRHRDFVLLWIGAFVSNVGTWMETVALGYYVTDLTQQALWSGIVAAAGFVPIAILGPVGGALADRLPRKRLLLMTTAAQTMLAGVVTALVAADQATPALVSLIVLASGCAGALGFPAFMASIPDLVAPDEVPAATGLSSTQYNMGRIVGPAAAAAVISVGGVAAALAANTLSFLAVIAAVAAVHLPAPHPSAGQVTLREAIPAGFRFVRREPGLWVSFRVMCLNTLFAAPFIALIPAMAVTVLDGDETTTSLLVTAQGVGAVAAGLTVGGLVGRYGIRRVMVGAVGLLPLALTLYGLAPTTAMVALALVVVGALYLTALNSFSTTAQVRAPAALRGRVLAVNTAVLGALYPLGALVQGRVADAIGLRATTVGAAVLMAATLLVVRALRPGFTAPLDEPVTSVDRPSLRVRPATQGSP